MRKVYVGVTAYFTPEGSVRPLEITWDDGRKFAVDRLIDCQRAASMKAGGVGLRYNCVISGKRVYLFQEEGRWFMEGKDKGR